MKTSTLITAGLIFLGSLVAVDSHAQEICRTAGFWGTHAGEERPGSTNITEGVMQAWLFSEGNAPTPDNCTLDTDLTLHCNYEPPGPAGSPKACRDAKKSVTTLLSPDFPEDITGLEICGKTIGLNPEGSVVEALCVSPAGDPNAQLARQLTAASLNCIMGSGNPNCEGSSIGQVFATCNSYCGDPSQQDNITLCIEKVDCFNNGGEWNELDPNAMFCNMDVATSCHGEPLTFEIEGDGGPILQ